MSYLLRRPAPPVTPALGGWRHLSFRWGPLPAAERGSTGSRELALVVVAGRVEVSTAGGVHEAGTGRIGPFDGLPEAVYLPPGTDYEVRPAQEGSYVGFCEAEADPGRTGPTSVVRAADVEVEIRGAGNATRQINHLLKPDFPAHRLLVVEVLTPAGSWSSYPPHKHDELRTPDEVVLEEVYAYRIARPEGFGVQRLYTRDGGLDEVYVVHDGDVVLVPRGYHPFVAGHGFDCYYLNALAGDVRSMAASDDPDLAWTRAAWAGQEPDPRVPLVGSAA